MTKEGGKLIVHHSPPRVLLRSALQEVFVEGIHADLWAVLAVVQDEHVGVVDAQVHHDFGRESDPTVDDHGHNALQQSLESLGAYFDQALLDWLCKVLYRFGVGIT